MQFPPIAPFSGSPKLKQCSDGIDHPRKVALLWQEPTENRGCGLTATTAMGKSLGGAQRVAPRAGSQAGVQSQNWGTFRSWEPGSGETRST